MYVFLEAEPTVMHLLDVDDSREVRVQPVQVSMWALLQSLPVGEVWTAIGGSSRADGERHLAVPSLLRRRPP